MFEVGFLGTEKHLLPEWTSGSMGAKNYDFQSNRPYTNVDVVGELE